MKKGEGMALSTSNQHVAKIVLFKIGLDEKINKK